MSSLTLLVSCLSAEVAVMASDRRVSLPTGEVEDRANKAVIFNRQSAWAYTGPAMMSSRWRTDEWLATQFQKEPKLQEATFRIRDAASQRLRTWPPGRADRRLAVVGVGFAEFRPPAGDGTKQPFRAVISNFFRPPDSWRPTASATLTALIAPLRSNEHFSMHVAGQMPDQHWRQSLDSSVELALRSEAVVPALVETLFQHITQVSDSNPKVGKNLSAVVIPNSVRMEGDFQIIGGRFSAEHPSWFYSGQDEVWYGPAATVGDTLIGGMIFGPVDQVDPLKRYGPFPPYRLTKLRA